MTASGRSDRDRAHAGFMLMRILASADRISAVSRRQQDALLGQIGLVGRLNRHNVGAQLTHTIPCAVDLDTPPLVPNRKSQTANRKSQTPFTVCLGGSFNTWMDVETLSSGLADAMGRRPSMRVCVTGGAIPGYGERLYETFVGHMRNAGVLDRVTLHGWLPNEAVAAIHAACNVGLNVDRWSVEGVLGSRNRLIQWLHLGLPVITTPLTEVAEDLARAGGALTFPIGDAKGLADILVAASDDPAPLRESLARGQAFTRREYGLAHTVRDVLDWVGDPTFAPDRAALGANVPLNSTHESFMSL